LRNMYHHQLNQSFCNLMNSKTYELHHYFFPKFQSVECMSY